MFWKTPKCPHCTKPLRTMGVDFANVKVICANCQQEVDPGVFINSYNVDYLAELIPEEHKENFLKELGFEKKAGNVIPKGILRFLVTFIVILFAIGGIVSAIIHIQGNIFYVLLRLLATGVLVAMFISYYKEATKVKWRKIKKS